MTRRKDNQQTDKPIPHRLLKITTDKDLTAYHAYCACGELMVRRTELDALAAVERHVSNMAAHS